ncbi:uncharacterized protein L201_001198 [Kwoniella dendrophila CBS 6074]|uniref:RING-type domain-containing protein n=1 Tax=Kwoniella dendrophila CBS 6074 TaxID=1295534 RepID=A0AAX4JP48_9TREE
MARSNKKKRSPPTSPPSTPTPASRQNNSLNKSDVHVDTPHVRVTHDYSLRSRSSTHLLNQKQDEDETNDDEDEDNDEDDQVSDTPSKHTRSRSNSNLPKSNQDLDHLEVDNTSKSKGAISRMKTKKKKSFIVGVIIPKKSSNTLSSSTSSSSARTDNTKSTPNKKSKTHSHAKVVSPNWIKVDVGDYSTTATGISTSAIKTQSNTGNSTSSSERKESQNTTRKEEGINQTCNAQPPPTEEFEAECIICSEELSEILENAIKQGKGGLGGGLSLWSCELGGCGALFCIGCAMDCIDRSKSKSEKPICPACTREWNTTDIQEQAKAYDPSKYTMTNLQPQQTFKVASASGSSTNTIAQRQDTARVAREPHRTHIMHRMDDTPRLPPMSFENFAPTIPIAPSNASNPTQPQRNNSIGRATSSNDNDGFVRVGNGIRGNPHASGSSSTGTAGYKSRISERKLTSSRNRYTVADRWSSFFISDIYIIDLDTLF